MLFRIMKYILNKHEEKVTSKIIKIIYKTVDCDHAIQIGDWYCDKSPFGICAYDLDEDSCCDECIYCGEPDERK